MNLSPDSDAALPPEDLALLRNHSFDELGVGDSASLERTLSTQDLRLFAALSGAAVADGAGAGAGARAGAGAGTVARADDDDAGLIAHGMWGGMLLASVLGTRLPGPGTTLVGQTLRFLAPLAAGDRLTVRVEVLAKQAEQRQVTLAVACTNQHGAAVIRSEERRVGKECRSRCDWSSDVCSSDLGAACCWLRCWARACPAPAPPWSARRCAFWRRWPQATG